MSGRERVALVAILLLGLALRMVVLDQYEERHPLADRPVIDELSYEQWGIEIARGDWLGDEVFFQEPLYPYWIGVVYGIAGEDRGTLRRVQACLGVLTGFLVWLVARRLFGPAAALVAAAGWALHRPALLFPALLLKPNLFLPILAGLALALVAAVGARGVERRRGVLLLAGVLAGAGALLRGNVLVLLPLIACAPLLAPWTSFRRRLAGAALVAVGAAAVLTPVALRNWYVGDVFALTTSGAGTNVYGGNNARNPYGTPRGFDWVRGIPEFEADDWRHEAERRLGRTLSPTEVSSYWLAEVGRSIRTDPLLHLRILWNKLRLSLGAYEVPDNHHLEWDARFVPLLRAPLPGFALLGWLGLTGLLAFVGRGLARARQAPGRLVLALLFLAYLATIVLTVTSMRARLALVPLLLPFAGDAAVRIASAARRPRELAPWCAAAAVAALAVFPPVLDREERAEKLAVRDFNLLTYRIDEGAPTDELLADVRELDRRYPRTTRVWSLHAEVELRAAREALAAGDGERARALAASALRRLDTVAEASGDKVRERHGARLLAGEVHRFLGDSRAAAAAYRDALEFDPEDARARRGLAEALLALGAGGDLASLREAVPAYRAALELEPRETVLRVGLANALYLLAEDATGAEAADAREECVALLTALEAEGEDVGALLERVR